MKRYLIVFAAALAAIFLSSYLYCQEDSVKTVDGRVVSVDPQASVMVVKSSETFAFNVDPHAQITDQNGLDRQLSDIMPGNYVMVSYYTGTSGKRVAVNIEIEYEN